jgi:hypothetical protein
MKFRNYIFRFVKTLKPLLLENWIHRFLEVVRRSFCRQHKFLSFLEVILF